MTDFWKGRPVLVTGATGLVGSWLSRCLVERGAAAVALVRDWDPQSELVRSGTIHRMSVVQGALEDCATVERAVSEHEIDTVFHLGAQALVGVAQRSPLQTFESNIRGTYNLLEACRVHSGLVKRVVVASSDKAYGSSEILPYVEEMPPLGRHPYDVSKSCADLLAIAYHHSYRLPVAVLRCGNIYGGGDLNWSRIVPGTIRSLLRSERPVVRSDGGPKRDYVYIQDAVAAYRLVAERLDDPAVCGEPFNFGPGEPCTVIEIVAALRRIMGRTDLEPLILDQAAGEIRDQFLSSAKARRILNWAPAYSLEAGLTETAAWYRGFLGMDR